jgi:hypothetical protein
MSKLHIYAQSYCHSDAWIVGDYTALRALRDAIDRVIAPTHASDGVPLPHGPEPFVGFKSYTADGEEYNILILNKEDINNIRLPYTHEEGMNKFGKHPVHLVSMADYRQAVRGKK